MSPEEATHLVAVLAAAYPRTPVSHETMQVYGRYLVALDYDIGVHAIDRLLSSGSRFPAVSEILDAAAQIVSPQPGPYEAWAILGSLTGDELPAAVRVAYKAIGGYWGLRSADNVSVLRAQFTKAYEEAVRADRADTVRAILGELAPPDTREELTP